MFSELLVREMAKVYAYDEVSKHRAIKDCWLVIDGKVRSFLFISEFRFIICFLYSSDLTFTFVDDTSY